MSCFFENTNKIDKPLVQVIKRKIRNKNKIRKKREVANNHRDTNNHKKIK